MPIADLYDALPPYAADVRANLKLLAEDATLGDAAKWGCFLACAWSLGRPELLRALDDAPGLDAQAREAARTAASIMAMNTVYYRALSQMENPQYGNMPAKLRVTALQRPGVERPTYELWCLSVSALNGCGRCLDAHEKELRTQGEPPERVQTALRIAAVVHAVAAVLAAEAAGAPAEAGRGRTAPDDTPG